MPVVSIFNGLIVYMYFLDTKQHKQPHIHVKYAEHEAVFSIPEGDLLEGSIPKAKTKLIVAWIELRKEDLMANWALAVKGEPIYQLEPLK